VPATVDHGFIAGKVSLSKHNRRTFHVGGAISKGAYVMAMYDRTVADSD